MKFYGYSQTVDEARQWKELHRKERKNYPKLEVASELDKTLFGTDESTGNPSSFMAAAENVDPTVFASRYGTGTTGNSGADADTALECVQGSNESDDAFVGRMKSVAESSETTSD